MNNLKNTLWGLIVALLWICGPPGLTQDGSSQRLAEREIGAYEIQVGDVLEVAFFKTPELNQT